MPFLGAVLSIAGGVVGAAGSIASGNAQAAVAEYQAAVARNNAMLGGMQAANARQIGHQRAAAAGLEAAQQYGRLKAALGAQGVDPRTGSNAAVLAGQRAVNVLKQQTQEYGGEEAGWQSMQKGLEAAEQSQVYSAEAGAARTAGYLGAAGSLIKGVSAIPGLGSIAGGGGAAGGVGAAGSNLFGSATPVAGGNYGSDVWSGGYDVGGGPFSSFGGGASTPDEYNPGVNM